MARDFGHVNVEIWSDPEFRRLPPAAQHLYLLLWTSPGLNYCGVHDWRPGRLAALSHGFSAEHIATVGDCLRSRYFLVVDDDTEEVLVRSWARFDGLLKQPRMAVSFVTAYATVASETIRSVLVHEATKIRQQLPNLTCWKDSRVISILEHPTASAKDLAVPEDPFGAGFGDGLDLGLPQTRGRVSPRVSPPPTPSPAPTPYSSTPSGSGQSSSEAADATPDQEQKREDVERLVAHLTSRIEGNAGKRPRTGKTWTTAARLMLDRDGYTEGQVRWLIDKAQDDEFWRANILSMPKLREKATQLELKFRAQPPTQREPFPEHGTQAERDEWARRQPRAVGGWQ